MSDYAYTILEGRLCSDPELKYTQAGKAVAQVNVAVNKSKPEGDQKADFFTVILWEKTAEFAANYCKKGDLVLVAGRPRNRKWTAQDGTNRSSFEVTGHEFKKLTPASQNGGGQGGNTPPNHSPADADFNDPFADA